MAAEPTWTVRQVLETAEQLAARREAGPSRADVARCLADVLGVDRLKLLLEHERPLSAAERAEYRARLQRLLDGEPLAYVLGAQEFWSRTFAVDRSVLIPRPETELLVELAIARLPESARVFEPCTGSGCVGISLALERPDVRVCATDSSPAALAVAAGNRDRLGAEIELLEGSFWQPVTGRVFDALLANPPYVDPDRPELLAEAVRRFEPANALYGPAGNPLHSYRQLLTGGVDGLSGGAAVLLEVGVDTAEGVLDLVKRSKSYDAGELIRDLAGVPRVLACRRR